MAAIASGRVRIDRTCRVRIDRLVSFESENEGEARKREN